jgi:hypothetical protein
MYMRSLLKKKLREPSWIVPKRLPLSFVGKDKRIRKQLHELKGMPSVFVPVESKIQDFSDLGLIDSETRWERDKRNRLLKEVY